MRTAIALALFLAPVAFAQAPDVQPILAKIATRKQPYISYDEFLVYLRAVEAAPKNAQLGWGQIVSKLHATSHPQDVNRRVYGVKLFKFGPENQGWENVDDLGAVPIHMQNPQGEDVEVGHSYAGARALVERHTTSWFMGNVNTGWGDNFQIVSQGYVGGSLEYMAGCFTLDLVKINAGGREVKYAHRYKPDYSVRGNTMGMRLMNWLAENRTKKLSEAYVAAFAEEAEERRRRDSGPPTTMPPMPEEERRRRGQ